MLFSILLTQQSSNVTNGTLGVALDSLIVRCETIVWGGTTATGQTYPAVGGLLVNVAAALGAIFAICVAAKIAFKMMTEGKGIDVLAVMRPILFAFVLANWGGVCGGLYSLVKPVERSFRSAYVYGQERVDSLRFRRDTLSLVLRGEIDAVKAELIVSEVRARHGITDEEQKEEKENQPIDGDLISYNAKYSYKDVEFGDILYDELRTKTDENGEEKPEVNVKELIEKASMFSWMEDVIRWVSETIWSIALYFIFIVKYIFTYVLIMFGPVYMACSILEVWKDKWSDWVGRFVVVSMYGAAAYLILTFGSIIIEYTVNTDIMVFEKALLNEDNFVSYLQKASRMTGLSSVGMYFMALLVTSIALGATFELAGFVFPATIGRSAADFVSGAVDYIKVKVEQAKEAAVATVVTAATGGTSMAAYATQKAMEKFMQDDEESESETDIVEPIPEDEGPDGGSSASAVQGSTTDSKPEMSGTHSTKDEKTEQWIQDAEEADRLEAERLETIQALGGLDSPKAKLFTMADDAYKWADRQAYLTTMGAAYKVSREDLAAEMRDNLALQKAEKMGIRSEYEKLREARLRENRFLLNVVASRAVVNSSLTRKQKKLIEKYGYEKAMQKDKDLRYKMLFGLPRLTSPGALFFMDTQTSPREHRKMLKSLGVYEYAKRAELLRRLANSLIRPGYVQKEKIFFFFTWRTKDKTFRNALQRRLYQSCINNLNKTEALIAMKARQILDERDVHVDSYGHAVRVKGMPLYWREDIDLQTYMEAGKHKSGATYDDHELNWFVGRYDTADKARQLLMQLEVFEAKKRVDDADDFVIERQLKALDDEEREMWRNIDQDGKTYQTIKKRTESLIEYYGKNNFK